MDIDHLRDNLYCLEHAQVSGSGLLYPPVALLVFIKILCCFMTYMILNSLSSHCFLPFFSFQPYQEYLLNFQVNELVVMMERYPYTHACEILRRAWRAPF